MTDARPSLASEPLVSVTVPVFNGEAYLADSLRSVLTQPYRRIEVLVVDDGSTDRSVEIAQNVADDRCRVLRQDHGGAAAARNLGVAESNGALLAFLDADDLWLDDTLTCRMHALSNDPALDMVFGHYVTLGADGTMPTIADVQPGYAMGTLLIRRESFLNVGPLSTEWRVGEFIDWYARAEEAGLRHVILPEVMLGRRVHGGNLTRRDVDARADYARVVHAAIVRRKLADRRLMNQCQAICPPA